MPQLLIQTFRRNPVPGFLFILIFLAIEPGCAPTRKISAGNMYTGNLTLHGSHLSVDLLLPVSNQSSYSIRIRKYQFNLENGKEPLAQISGDRRIIIKPRVDSVYAFPVKIRYTDLLRGGLHSAMDLARKGQVEVQINGFFSGWAGFIPFRRKIRQKVVLVVP